MTLDGPRDVTADAIAWHVRLRTGGEADWLAFVDWLEADPEHQTAYDAVEEADVDLGPLVADRTRAHSMDAAPLPRHRGWHRTRTMATGLAAPAMVAAIVAGGVAWRSGMATDRYVIATQAGERRVVALDAGTRIVLNGATRLVLDRRDPRYAALDSGEALFTVRHDAAAPFTVHVGDNAVRDMGTTFDVVHQDGSIRIAVAAGRVVYNPDREAISVAAGGALVDAPDADIALMPIAPRDVGGWTQGRLSYVDAPYARVAEDVSRASGQRIMVAPELAARRFAGTLMLDGPIAPQMDRLGRILQVRLVRTPAGWRMEAGGGGAR